MGITPIDPAGSGIVFSRRLSDAFIDELNRLYRAGAWWRMLADSPDVFLAIRADYLSAYAGGMSVGKVAWDGRRVRLEVHEEYVTLASPAASPYVDLLAGEGRSRPVIRTADEYVTHFAAVRSRAALFAGAERQGTNTAARKIGRIIDMEAAFTAEAEGDELEPGTRTSRPGRLDLVGVSAGGRVVACEAKLFGNAELRSRDQPVVCRQLAGYHRWLGEHAAEIAAAYANVIGYYRRLEGAFFDVRRALWPAGPLRLDPVPRLWIFDHDRSQEFQAREIAKQVAQKVSIPGFKRDHVVVVGSPSKLKLGHLIKP